LEGSFADLIVDDDDEILGSIRNRVDEDITLLKLSGFLKGKAAIGAVTPSDDCNNTDTSSK
jgi:hypothetical protein